MKAAGLDTEESAAKISEWQTRQRDFLEQTGLKRQWDREQIGKVAKITGLGAKQSGSIVHSVPKFAGKIDISDAKLVESKLREFMDSVAGEPIEHAFVILQNGKTYHLTGISDRVDPEMFGAALQGAIVSHNHPAAETTFSFSEDDFDLFQRCQLSKLYGFDYRYQYVLGRHGELPRINKLSINEMTADEYWHQRIYTLAEEKGVYYERIERTASSGRK